MHEPFSNTELPEGKNTTVFLIFNVNVMSFLFEWLLPIDGFRLFTFLDKVRMRQYLTDKKEI